MGAGAGAVAKILPTVAASAADVVRTRKEIMMSSEYIGLLLWFSVIVTPGQYYVASIGYQLEQKIGPARKSWHYLLHIIGKSKFPAHAGNFRHFRGHLVVFWVHAILNKGCSGWL
jgi:hypothetical protein